MFGSKRKRTCRSLRDWLVRTRYRELFPKMVYS